jgi:hypothetical protein
MPLPVSLNGQPPVQIEVPELRYTHCSTQETGGATIAVPVRSAAYTSAHIREDQPFLVRIGGRLGEWTGIALGLDKRAGVYTIRARELSILLGIKPVSRSRSFAGRTAQVTDLGAAYSPGYIVREALREAFGGESLAAIAPGTIFEGGPFFRTYEFAGQPVAQVIRDCQQRGNQEWRLRGLLLDWLPQVATAYAPLLCEGDALVEIGRTVDFFDQVWQLVTHSPDAVEVIVRSIHTGGLWGPVRVQNVGSDTFPVRFLEAASELNRVLMPLIQPSFGLLDVGTHWDSVREGMAIRALAPSVGFTRQQFTARVLGRTYREGSRVLGLDLQYLPQPEGIGIAGIGLTIPDVVSAQRTDARNELYNAVQLMRLEQFRASIGGG